MDLALFVLFIVVIAGLAFEYINGFHDSANAIATVVSTKVLTPRQAVMYAGVLNLIGAFSGVTVAKTISSGLLIHSYAPTQIVIFCALFAAIIWNLITWFFAIPSSSSHALIGGLIGSAMVGSGLGTRVIDFLGDPAKGYYFLVKLPTSLHSLTILWPKSGLMGKVIIPMFLSPIIGVIAGFIVMLLLLWCFAPAGPEKVNKWFRKSQLLSSGVMAYSHGCNDAQKTMGILTLALLSKGIITSNDIPIYVIAACALTMGLGTMAGGWRIIRTMGSKVIKLKPIHGFAAETAAAGVILTASHFGMPISTTHIISTSIMGVGATKGSGALKWSLIKRIVTAWVVTIPACMMIAAVTFYIIQKVF
jgi:PiT family inorganic phosphate transporter